MTDKIIQMTIEEELKHILLSFAQDRRLSHLGLVAITDLALQQIVRENEIKE